MTSERDDLDDRLLAEGRYAELVAAYYPAMLARLRMRLPTGAVFDVAHDVAERLLSELRRGKQYPIPFRAVVHQVTGWTLFGYSTKPVPPNPGQSLRPCRVKPDAS